MPVSQGRATATRLSLEQRLALYNAGVVTMGAVLAAIAWFPDFEGKQQELSAFSQLRYDLALDDDLNDPAVTSFFKDRHKAETSPGGGLTGAYVPGHVSGHSAHFVVLADPDSYINVTITYGMDRPSTLWQRLTGKHFSSLFDGANLVDETVRLGDASLSDCKFGINVQNSLISSACGASPL